MSSSRACRTEGLLALCLVVGVVLSGALGGAQQSQPIPQLQIIVKGDPGFKELADHFMIQMTGKCPAYCFVMDEGRGACPRECEDAGCCLRRLHSFGTVKECGTTIAETFINPDPRVAAARSYDNGPLPIGGARSYDDGSYLLGKGELPQGDYLIWLANFRRLPPPPPELMVKLPFEPDLHWFIIFVGAKIDLSVDSKIGLKVDMKDIAAIAYYPDEVFRTPEEWLRAIGSAISLEEGRGCDLTVRRLSLSATKITPPCPPCTAPPCPCSPPYWILMAHAIIANIGQIDVKEPFAVQFLLDGFPFHEEWITELAAGAQRTVSATEEVGSPGLYIVTVMVDPAARIKELDEGNNEATSIILLR